MPSAPLTATRIRTCECGGCWLPMHPRYPPYPKLPMQLGFPMHPRDPRLIWVQGQHKLVVAPQVTLFISLDISLEPCRPPPHYRWGHLLAMPPHSWMLWALGSFRGIFSPRCPISQHHGVIGDGRIPPFLPPPPSPATHPALGLWALVPVSTRVSLCQVLAHQQAGPLCHPVLCWPHPALQHADAGGRGSNAEEDQEPEGAGEKGLGDGAGAHLPAGNHLGLGLLQLRRPSHPPALPLHHPQLPARSVGSTWAGKEVGGRETGGGLRACHSSSFHCGNGEACSRDRATAPLQVSSSACGTSPHTTAAGPALTAAPPDNMSC